MSEIKREDKKEEKFIEWKFICGVSGEKICLVKVLGKKGVEDKFRCGNMWQFCSNMWPDVGSARNCPVCQALLQNTDFCLHQE